MFPIVIGMTLFQLASSSSPALAAYSVQFRIIAGLVVIAPMLWRRPFSSRTSSTPLHGLWVFQLGLGIVLVASTALHGDVRALLTGALPLIFLSLMVWTLCRYYSGRQIVDGSYISFMLVGVASLVLWQIEPISAVENDRLRGVMENANGLGFTAFMLGAISLMRGKRTSQVALGLGVATTLLFLSGSRASALALVIVAIGMAITGSRRARMLLVLGTLTGVFAWLVFPHLVSGVMLFRTTDTRSLGFGFLEQSMSDSFWVGWGEMPSNYKIAGSVFAAGITGGMIGLIGLGLMYLSLLVTYHRSRPRTFALVLAGIAHSLFESWMLSPSAPMLVNFLVVTIGLATLDLSRQSSAPALVLHARPSWYPTYSEPIRCA